MVFTCTLFTYFTLAEAAPTSVTIECPPSVTIYCKDSYSDLDKWGKAWLWENYVKKHSLQPKEVLYNLNSCGIGKIIRKWEYEDKHWNMHYCTQEITIVAYGDPFGLAEITWPLNYEIEGCNPNVDPKSLPKTYNYPTFKAKSCSQPMYSYQDMKFNVSEGCMKVLRSWKVIDWCQYVPNSKNNAGLWTYTQVIKISAKDSTARIICPRDTSIMALTDCDGAYVKLDSAYGVSKCGPLSKITNNSPYSIHKGADASGKYPLGTTTFYYHGEYGCGQQLSCKVTINVVNKVGPTPYCLNGLIVALMPVDANKDGIPEDGMIEVWAKDVDHGSFAKCGNKNLVLSFSSDVNDRSRIFTCADLGKNHVELWVTDQYGNKSFCKTYIEVQNNNANIPDCKRDSAHGGNTSFLTIAGNLQGEDPSLVDDATLSLIDMNSYTITERNEYSINIHYDTIKTQSGTILYVERRDTLTRKIIDSLKGKVLSTLNSTLNTPYIFKDITKNKDYKIIPNNSNPNLKGLNIEDAIVLLRHTLGLQSITNPYKKIAADINNDGKISSADFDLFYGVLTGKKQIGHIPRLWRYLPISYNPSYYPSGLQEYNMYLPLSKDMSKEDFVAIKIGNLSKINNSGTVVSRNSNSEYYASCNQYEFSKEIASSINFQFNETHKAIVLNHSDKFDFEVYDEDFLFDESSSILLSKNENGFKNLELQLKPKVNLSIYDSDFQTLFNTLDGSPIDVRYNSNVFSATIYPNPVRECKEFQILYSGLSQDKMLQFEIFNFEGKSLFKHTYSQLASEGSLKVQLPEFLQESIYIYTLASSQNKTEGKIIVSK